MLTYLLQKVVYSTELRYFSLSIGQRSVDAGAGGRDLVHLCTEVVHVILKPLKVVFHLKEYNAEVSTRYSCWSRHYLISTAYVQITSLMVSDALINLE